MKLPLGLSISAFTLSVVLTVVAAQQPAPKRTPDVIYVPTPPEVVEVMLRLAEVDNKDVLYDLGCGDGRIPITAAKKHGARGVCVDIDPQRIRKARENAKQAGVVDRVKIIEGDLFETDLRPATAVTLYLLNSLNLKLRPKLLQELKPGTPVVSHDFHMDDWKPEEEIQLGGHKVYKWRIPARAAGTWRWQGPAPQRAQYELVLQQKLQRVDGTLLVNGHRRPVQNGHVTVNEIRFEVPGDNVQPALRFEGNIAGSNIRGRVRAYNGTETAWSATLAGSLTRAAAVAGGPSR